VRNYKCKDKRRSLRSEVPKGVGGFKDEEENEIVSVLRTKEEGRKKCRDLFWERSEQGKRERACIWGLVHLRRGGLN